METGSDLGYRNSDRSFTYARLNPKIRDTIFVHANSSGWKGDLQPFLCLGAGAAGALCLATTVSIASPGFLGRSGRGSTTHTIKLAPAKARVPHS
jgi:hypothetical protein